MPSHLTTPDLSKVDQERLAQSGIDLSMNNRCGSFLQMDQDVVHAECSQEGIEILSYAKAFEKYAWLKDYNWKMISPDKDDVTKYVAAQKDPKGYVIIAHKGSSNIFPIQACLYLGKDQIQHVEIARDIAIKFNNQYGDILTIPQFKVQEEVQTVPGIDGQKMSKSYGNIVNIFGEEKSQLKTIKKIVTENVAMEEPKEYETCNVYNMAKLFLEGENLLALQERYKSGGEGHGHFKVYLAEVMWEYFKDFRQKREYFEAHQDEVREILQAGSVKAREAALPTIEKIRSVTGIRY
jgi:hypothetical protein